MSTINFNAIGLLEVLNSHLIVQWLVIQLETIWDQDMNGDGEKYYCIKNFLRGGETLTTFLI